MPTANYASVARAAGACFTLLRASDRAAMSASASAGDLTRKRYWQGSEVGVDPASRTLGMDVTRMLVSDMRLGAGIAGRRGALRTSLRRARGTSDDPASSNAWSTWTLDAPPHVLHTHDEPRWPGVGRAPHVVLASAWHELWRLRVRRPSGNVDMELPHAPLRPSRVLHPERRFLLCTPFLSSSGDRRRVGALRGSRGGRAQGRDRFFHHVELGAHAVDDFLIFLARVVLDEREVWGVRYGVRLIVLSLIVVAVAVAVPVLRPGTGASRPVAEGRAVSGSRRCGGPCSK